MTLEQKTFDFGDDTIVPSEQIEHLFTNIYDNTGKTIGVSTAPPSTFYGPSYTSYGTQSTTYNINANSGAITGAIGATGPSLWSYGTTGATGASGYYNITSNINHPTITFSDNAWINNSHALDVKGDANFEGDVKIKGKSIVETLDKIEQRLAILAPNTELEDKWDELKELANKYKELEKEILEKQKMWDILKK